MRLNTKEEKIKSIAGELIPKKLKNNLLNLLSDICINRRDSEIINTNKELKMYSQKIEKYTKELNDVLMMPVDERSSFCEEVLNTAKDIIRTFNCIHMYNRFRTIIATELYEEEDYREVKKDKSFKDFELDSHEVMVDCTDYIYDCMDEFEISRRKSLILGCIPLKMTKQKYNDCLRESLNEVLDDFSKNDVINLIELYKMNFAPFNNADYGREFDFIREKLSALNEIDILALSDDELNEAIETAKDIMENIEEIKEILSSFYNDTGYIINVVLFSVDNEYLFNDDIMFKDLYYSTKSIIEDDKNEVFIEDILDRIYDMIESMENDISAMDKNFDDIFDMIDIEKVSEDVYTYITTKIKIDENFQKELILATGEYFSTQDGDDIAETEFVNNKIDEFLEYVKSACAGISNKFAKLIKRLFFEGLICCMDDDEYEEYIKFVIDDLKNTERDIVYIINLNRMLTIYSYKNQDAHHHDCDCEHHH